MTRETVHGREEVEFPQIELCRPDLADLPPITLPPGYLLRSYRPGDEVAWGEIMSQAFSPYWNLQRFRTLIRPHFGFRPERILFVCQDGRPVGSACAFNWPGLPAAVGFIHMLAVLESHCGRGLGQALTLACLDRFREEGAFQSALLQTESFRLPAIKHYLRLGFRPVLVRDWQRDKWREVLRRLGMEDQIEKLEINTLPIMSDFAFYLRTSQLFAYLFWLQATAWMR